MPLTNYSRLFEWARITLDVDEKVLPDGKLQFLAPSVLSTFLIETPCASDGNGGYSGLDIGDKAAIEEAVGARLAKRFLETKAGQSLFEEIQIKLGPVTRTKKAATIDGVKADCEKAAQDARKRISCVRDAKKVAGTTPLFGLAGTRRSKC